ncbi:MAG: hypothetical protein IJN13_00995 [Bacilli bacterium]|nr:hypothetical protein [Bacilli bacterium]
MKNNSKKLIIIIVIILGITSIIALYFGFKSPNDNNQNNNPGGTTTNPGTSSSNLINKEISLLTVEDEYLKIQNTINDYYTKLSIKDNAGLYKILEKSYILENNITANNVTDVIYSNYETVNYTAKEIYYNKNSSVTYYFVNGYVFNQTIMEDDFSYEKNVNYMIIVKNGYYVIRPLSNQIEIENYAKNYNIKDIDINSKTKLVTTSVSEKNKLITYITEFMNLLILDNERAYNMLDDETKNKYYSYDYFYTQRYDIYNNFSANIFATSKTENEENIIYSIKDSNQRTIKITEFRIMDYKIGF